MKSVLWTKGHARSAGERAYATYLHLLRFRQIPLDEKPVERVQKARPSQVVHGFLPDVVARDLGGRGKCVTPLQSLSGRANGSQSHGRQTVPEHFRSVVASVDSSGAKIGVRKMWATVDD